MDLLTSIHLVCEHMLNLLTKKRIFISLLPLWVCFNSTVFYSDRVRNESTPTTVLDMANPICVLLVNKENTWRKTAFGNGFQMLLVDKTAIIKGIFKCVFHLGNPSEFFCDDIWIENFRTENFRKNNFGQKTFSNRAEISVSEMRFQYPRWNFSIWAEISVTELIFQYPSWDFSIRAEISVSEMRFQYPSWDSSNRAEISVSKLRFQYPRWNFSNRAKISITEMRFQYPK